MNTSTNLDIVQVGYGACGYADNDLGYGAVCDGLYHWYWAWGGKCNGIVSGSGGSDGPIPIRLGSALSDPPAGATYQVLRESVGGVIYYDLYVNGSLLQGYDARGYWEKAQVPASSVCWDQDSTSTRRMFFFGESWDPGDSLGGWVNGSVDHLDYTSTQYTIDSRWTNTNWASSGACNYEDRPSVYECTQAGSTHIYIDTNQ